MSDICTRRYREPGLFKAALAACACRLTDGFCTPANTDNCKCWDAADAVQKATGLSARGVAWVFSNIRRIEDLSDE